MISKISNYGTHNKNRSKLTFGAKIIEPKLGNKIEKTLFSTKNVDIYLHEIADYDTADAAIYMYNQYETRGIKAFLCADKKELIGLGIDPKNYRIKKKNSKPSEAALLLDHNGSDKVAKLYQKLLRKTKKVWEIDHHPETEFTLKNELSYIDTTAKSCCSILYRLAESTKQKLSELDLKKLYQGIASDFEKSKRIKFESTPDGSKIVRLPAIDIDKNSAQVLDRVENLLPTKDRININNKLDIISNLTPIEKDFRKSIASAVKVTPNGKLAYVVISPEDKELFNKWQEVGMDNPRSSNIMGDLRRRLINGVESDDLFTAKQLEKFKNSDGKIDIKGAIIFYPTAKDGNTRKSFQFSVHSKKDTKFCKKWTEYVKKAYKTKEEENSSIFNIFSMNKKHKLDAGGHDDRSGGRIYTYNKKSCQNLIDSFLEAAQNVE